MDFFFTGIIKMDIKFCLHRCCLWLKFFFLSLKVVILDFHKVSFFIIRLGKQQKKINVGGTLKKRQTTIVFCYFINNVFANTLKNF